MNLSDERHFGMIILAVGWVLYILQIGLVSTLEEKIQTHHQFSFGGILICNVADILVKENGVDKFPSQLLMNRFYLQKITDPYGFLFFVHNRQRTGQISMSSFYPSNPPTKKCLSGADLLVIYS